MNAVVFLNNQSHSGIRNWLNSALLGRQPLPLVTPDESPFLAVLRLEKELKPHARDSLRDACRDLISGFCAEGQGEPAFLEQVLGLASAFRDPETVAMLAGLATRFPKLPQLSPEVRLAVLATLVDTPPPQPPPFWAEILKQDPERYIGLALSGVLATNPVQAVQMLPAMPDTERMGQAAALKLDLAWDSMPPNKRFQFVQAVGQVLARCGPRFGGFVGTWVSSKQSFCEANTNAGREAALADAPGKPEKSSSERHPQGPADAAGPTAVHFLPMLSFVLLWAKQRLILVRENILREHAPNLEFSNAQYCADLALLVRHFRLGVELLRRGEWGPEASVWFNQINELELVLGRLNAAGISQQPPSRDLVERIGPIVSDSLAAIEGMLTRVQMHRRPGAPVYNQKQTTEAVL